MSDSTAGPAIVEAKLNKPGTMFLLYNNAQTYRPSLCSPCRYYLKNNMETETLCSDEDAQDLLRESQISLLQLSTMEVAAQLSMRDFELFRNIESTEYVVV